MIGNGGGGQRMKVTKETVQQVQGPDGQMMVKKTQQVVEQNIDTSQNQDYSQYQNDDEGGNLSQMQMNNGGGFYN